MRLLLVGAVDFTKLLSQELRESAHQIAALAPVRQDPSF